MDADEVWVMKAVVVLFCVFAVRDTLTGAARYYLDILGIAPIWFVPEFLAFPVFVYFAWKWAIQRRSFFAGVLVVNTLTATAVSILYMSWTPFQVISSVKMFMPIFIGLMMARYGIGDFPKARLCIAIGFALSLLGLLFSPLIDYPWLGQSISNFGTVRQLTRVWWIDDQIRHSGFATDSTMAAFMTVFLFLLLFRYLPRLVNFLILPFLFYAVYLSTSRTVMLVLSLFFVWYTLVEIVGWNPKVLADRVLARCSFATLLVPFLLILLLASTDLTAFSDKFYSLEDRIDNSWQLPFTQLAESFPQGLITGCGLGCYVYPMEYTALADQFVPIDNFYLASYLMLGAPFLVTVLGFFLAIGRTDERDKLMLMTLLNVYLTTVTGYGPSFSTLLVGYAYSNMVLVSPNRWRRRIHTTRSSGNRKALAT